MAKIILEEKEVTVKDGDSTVAGCEEMGIPFACQDGLCGTCRTVVLEGMENLTDLTEPEKTMGIEPPERLMCQCKIKSGVVKLKY